MGENEAERNTQLTELEAEIRRLRSALIQADYLALMGTLAGYVGHELNNLSTVFLGSLQFVEERARDGLPPEDTDMVALRYVSKHLGVHGKTLLRMVRGANGGVRPCEVGEALTDVLQLLEATGKSKYVTIRRRQPEHPVFASLERKRLEHVFLNLLTSATDALACVEAEDKSVSVEVEERDARVYITVEDNGCGIASEDLPRLFDLAFTTTADERGTGLGLVAVRSILEDANGSVRVESFNGRGTRVLCEVPTAV